MEGNLLSLPSGVRGCAMITVPERPRQTAQTPRSSGSLGPRGSCGPALPLRAAALVGSDLHVAGPTSAIWFAAPIATNGLPFGGCRPPAGAAARHRKRRAAATRPDPPATRLSCPAGQHRTPTRPSTLPLQEAFALSHAGWPLSRSAPTGAIAATVANRRRISFMPQE